MPDFCARFCSMAKPEPLLLVPHSRNNPVVFRESGISYSSRKDHEAYMLKIYLSFTIALLVAVLGRMPLLSILALNNIPNQNMFSNPSGGNMGFLSF